MMIRRGGGRTPPFSLVGLLLILLILGFKCWTLSSQNADLQQEIEKFQAEVKISAMKQEQSENKNAALQQTVHDMDSISEKLKKKLQEGEEVLKNKDQDNQKKAYEITSLKNKVAKMQEQINTLSQQVDDREMDITKAKETNLHLATERDDALEAISEKDGLINTLKRQLEQAQDEVAAARREHLAVAQPNIVPGDMNLPHIENKVLQTGAKPVKGNEAADNLVAPQHIDQVNPNGGIPPPPKPAGPAVVERPAHPEGDNNRPIAAPILPAIMDGEGPQNDVLAPPPHHLEDNLDAAIDEEEKIVEDLMDDQDEEGNEIRQNNDNIDEDNGQEDNKDLLRRSNHVGALEVPQVFHPEDDTHQDMNMGEDLGNQGNYYEANLDANIQNLRRPPKLP